MDVKDYEKIELQFEDTAIILPSNVIEKFQVQKIEQFIEKKYDSENEYDVYIVINRILAEEIWKNEISKKMEGIVTPKTNTLINLDSMLQYKTLADCINKNSIYNIVIFKGKQKETYSPVWSYTQFTNEYQKIGITNDKIMIHIKEI